MNEIFIFDCDIGGIDKRARTIPLRGRGANSTRGARYTGPQERSPVVQLAGTPIRVAREKDSVTSTRNCVSYADFMQDLTVLSAFISEGSRWRVINVCARFADIHFFSYIVTDTVEPSSVSRGCDRTREACFSATRIEMAKLRDESDCIPVFLHDESISRLFLEEIGEYA